MRDKFVELVKQLRDVESGSKLSLRERRKAGLTWQAVFSAVVDLATADMLPDGLSLEQKACLIAVELGDNPTYADAWAAPGDDWQKWIDLIIQMLPLILQLIELILPFILLSPEVVT